MKKVIRLKVCKELEGMQNASIIKLKGSLIPGCYTEIIHILDNDDEFHLNYFDIERGNFR